GQREGLAGNNAAGTILYIQRVGAELNIGKAGNAARAGGCRTRGRVQLNERTRNGLVILIYQINVEPDRIGSGRGLLLRGLTSRRGLISAALARAARTLI